MCFPCAPDLPSDVGFSYFVASVLKEREADSLRYLGLPLGDHSVVVEGLGKFAPSGSYAHGGVRGGLGDDDEEEVSFCIWSAILPWMR